MPTGKVAWYCDRRGYGFITPNEGPDLFFHVSVLKDDDLIESGTAVSFEVGPDLKSGKVKAIRVDLIA